MRLFISHGADPDDWFVVKPLEGQTSPGIIPGLPITPKRAVDSLLAAGRTVYELDVVPNEPGIYKVMGLVKRP